MQLKRILIMRSLDFNHLKRCYKKCTKHLNKEYNKLIRLRNNLNGTVVGSIVDWIISTMYLAYSLYSVKARVVSYKNSIIITYLKIAQS